MKYLDAVFDDAARNLACDEALLEFVEQKQIADDLLRVWESSKHFVVLGHANSLRSEVNRDACEARGITILRRMSGGGTVMQGPGCLNYALILRGSAHRLGAIGDVFRQVLDRHRRMIDALTGRKARIEGISDLTVSGRKVSGNAQYRKSRAVLVHGTFLLHFDLPLIDECLRVPAKQPAYRRARPHDQFLANLNLDSDAVRKALREVWRADECFQSAPLARIETLVKQRYGSEQWVQKF